MFRNQLLGFCSLVSVLLCLGCQKDAQNSADVKTPSVINVQTAKAIERDVQLSSEFTGKIVAISSVDIVPRIRGFLEAITYTDGAIVEPGQQLFKIQDFDYQIEVDKAKAELASAQAREASAKSTYLSAVKTNQQVQGTVSENDIIQYKSKWDEAKANVFNNFAQYKYQLRQLSYTKICSPIHGKVSKVASTPGDLLDGTGPNPPVLCTVTSMDPIYVEFEISDRYFDMSMEAVQKKHAQQLKQEESKEIKQTTNYPPSEEKELAEAAGSASTDPSPEAVDSKPESALGSNIPVADGNSAADSKPELALGGSIPVADDNSAEKDKAVQPETGAAENESSSATAPAAKSSAGTLPLVSPDPTAETPVSPVSGVKDDSLEDTLAKPFIPKPEDVAPSAVFHENTAYMKGETKLKEAEIPFELQLSDDPEATVFRGQLNYNDNRIDTATGTMTIRGVLDNPSYRLYPGHICTVKMNTQLKKGAIVIQERAICVDLSSHFVWVVNDKNCASKRYIEAQNSFENGTLRIIAPYQEKEVIRPDGTKEIAKTGLQAGETYIVEGFQKVREGSTVKAVK